jgi:ribosome-associated protein
MNIDPLELTRQITDVLDEKKGEDILLLDLIGECSFTDYFVICSGSSDRMLRALSQDVQQRVKTQFGQLPLGVEGSAESGWILLDFGDVVVHLFSPELRRYYKLEELWKEGQVLLHVR